MPHALPLVKMPFYTTNVAITGHRRLGTPLFQQRKTNTVWCRKASYWARIDLFGDWHGVTSLKKKVWVCLSDIGINFGLKNPIPE